MSLCLGGGGGDCRREINAIELQGAAADQGKGRGRASGHSPGGRRAFSSLMQRLLWVPSKPSHAQAPNAQHSDPGPWSPHSIIPAGYLECFSLIHLKKK